MYISEIMTTIPEDERCELETKVYKTLSSLQIPFERVDNDSVEAMEDCVEISDKLGAEIRKTIVVCNRKKTSIFLVVLPADKSFNTKTFCEKVGCSRVSFASAETMGQFLGVRPGAATVMSILNDEDDDVQVVIDKEVADAEWFACNPGANTTHIKFKTEHLLKIFLPRNYHSPIVAEL